MTLASWVTLVRVALAPVFLVLFIQDALWATAACVGLAFVFEMTDLFDGILARRRGEVSNFGKLFDPFADSVARFTVFLAFYAHPAGYCDLWMLLVFFYRDSTVSFVRVQAAQSNFVMSARMSGKIKAWFQGVAYIATLVLVLFEQTGWLALLGLEALDVVLAGRILVGIAALYTAYSCVDYVRAGIGVVRASEEPRSAPDESGENGE